MQKIKKRSHFLDSQEALDIRIKLQYMASSDLYNTPPSYSANSIKYPDNLIPFLDKHMNYIDAHPSLDADMYIANLRLMTRVR